MDILWLSCSTGAIAKDDTTVRGTEEVHYPAHVESVRVLRPELEPVSLEGHLEKKSADFEWFFEWCVDVLVTCWILPEIDCYFLLSQWLICQKWRFFGGDSVF